MMRIVYLMLTHLTLFALLKNKIQDWNQLIVLLIFIFIYGHVS